MRRRGGRSIGFISALVLVSGLTAAPFAGAQPVQEWIDGRGGGYRESRPEIGTAQAITAPQPSAAAVPLGAEAVEIPFLDAVSGTERQTLKHQLKEISDRQPWEFGQADNIQEFAVPEGVESYGHVVNASFPGLNRVTGAGGGFIWVPPDTVLAKGPNKVLQAVNSALRLFTPAGVPVQTMDLNTFFSYAAGGDPDRVLFDPKVFYDRNAPNPRFYVVALDFETNPNISRIYLAVSRSSDPAALAAANWCRYFINGVRNGGTASASWADYPGLGVGRDALIITANQFSFSTNSFTFAIIRALNKNVLSNNAAGCPALPTVLTWQPAGAISDGTVFTLQPAQSYNSPSSFTGTTNPAYILSTISGTSATYKVWRIRNVAGGAPTLGGPVNVVGNFTYSAPPDARQAGTALLLDTGSQRMVQAAGIGNAIYGAHGTACQFTGGTTVESCVRYIRLLVGQNASGGLTAAMSQQITFGGGDNTYFFWPGIAVNLVQKIIVVWQQSTPTSFLSAWRTGKTLAAGGFEPPVAVRTGTCAQTAYNRTGDYVGAQTDPGGTSFWVAGEMSMALTAGGTGCNWGTWIQKLTPP